MVVGLSISAGQAFWEKLADQPFKQHKVCCVSVCVHALCFVGSCVCVCVFVCERESDLVALTSLSFGFVDASVQHLTFEFGFILNMDFGVRTVLAAQRVPFSC